MSDDLWDFVQPPGGDDSTICFTRKGLRELLTIACERAEAGFLEVCIEALVENVHPMPDHERTIEIFAQKQRQAIVREIYQLGLQRAVHALVLLRHEQPGTYAITRPGLRPS